MTKIELENVCIFAILMQDVLNKSPEYMAKKYLMCKHFSEMGESARGILDWHNQKVLDDWKEFWHLKED